MTGKERVKTAFEHRQPDKVPVDFAGMCCSQFHITMVAKLREYYGLEKRPIKLWAIAEMVGMVEADLQAAMGTDVEQIRGFNASFGIPDTGKWKEWRYMGVDLLVPERFEIEPDGKGGWYIFPQGDRTAPPSGHLPEGGFYFDNLCRQQELEEENMDFHDNVEEYTEASQAYLDYLAAQREAYRGSSRAVVLNPGGGALGDASQIEGPGLLHPKGIRSVADWYTAPLLYPDYVHEIFTWQTDLFLRNIEKIYQVVGDAADICYICGTDFGSQESQMLSVATFEEFYLPYYQKVNGWIHKHTPWKTLKHCCGAIAPLLPGLIQAGFDAVNPVQCSAKGMDPATLKNSFGKDILFWGGGVDTQQVLPFGTPAQVRAQVLERCEIFSKDGGYIFTPIHNVQCGTPIENIVAVVDAVREFNGG